MGSTKLVETGEKHTDSETEVICSDFDEDCKEVKNKTLCWLYQPECGLCPYLKNNCNSA
jgi:hypothetical protein